ncbi:unnamed protein product [Aphanomyces euteiches]|nr:hypothetical protein Ae201684P_009237 [Aphanomyces euteiches]
MRLLVTLALFVLTAASGSSSERHLKAYVSRNLLEAAGGTVPKSGGSSSNGKPPKIPASKSGGSSSNGKPPMIPASKSGGSSSDRSPPKLPGEPHRAGLKGARFIKTHFDSHGKSAFGIREKKRGKMDINGRLRNPGGETKTPLSDPRRYDSPEIKNIRMRHHGLTSNGQLANPTRNGRSILLNPRRYDSPELKQITSEHHSGRKK